MAAHIHSNALPNFRTGNQRIATFARQGVIVGNSMFMGMMFDMFKSMNVNIAEHFTLVHTLEEARAHLAQGPMDKTLQAI